MTGTWSGVRGVLFSYFGALGTSGVRGAWLGRKHTQGCNALCRVPAAPTAKQVAQAAGAQRLGAQAWRWAAGRGSGGRGGQRGVTTFRGEEKQDIKQTRMQDARAEPKQQSIS